MISILSILYIVYQKMVIKITSWIAKWIAFDVEM